MTGTFERFDARPGGSYRLVIHADTSTSPGKATAETDIVESRFIDARLRGRADSRVREKGHNQRVSRR
jgi:hypothetical protein